MKFNIIKDKYDISFQVEIELDGGTGSSFIDVTLGKKYKFPVVSKTNYEIEGWYSDSEFTNKITEDDYVDYSIRKLYIKWIEINGSEFEFTTTSSYKTAGFAAGAFKSGSTQATVDWGDGTVQTYTSMTGINHTYSTVGTFIVKVSDDLSSLTVCGDSSTYYARNRYTLTKVLKYGKSITTIPDNCYYYAEYLTDIEALMPNVTTMGSRAFYYCQRLKSLSFIKNTQITELPYHGFYSCKALTNLDGCQNIKTLNTSGFQFELCRGLSSFNGLGNVSTLPRSSFYHCTSITSLSTLPASVTSYGKLCLGLTKISDLSKIRSTDTLNSYCFADMNSLTSLTTLTKRSSLPSYVFYNCTGLKNVDLSQWTSLTSIPNNAFERCSSLSSVTLPSTIKSIGSYAFYSTALRNTNFLSATKVTNIQDYTFSECTSLSSISLPEKTTSIGSYAFANNYSSYNKDLNLSRLTALTSIGTYAFNNDYNLLSATLPSSLTSIGDYAFAGCYRLSSMTCLRDNAPTVYTNTFGSTAGTGSTAYTGSQTASTGNNRLYVKYPDNYQSYWRSVLLADNCGGFKIVSTDPTSIQSCIFSGVENRYVVTGSAITPVVTVKTSSGTTLTEDTHYQVSYSNNVSVGTATITITGIGTYHGTQILTFKIYDPSQQSLTVDLNSQWQTPTQWTNSNTDFDVYESNSNYHVANGYAKMFITVNGYDELTIYINSYAESYYDYTIAFTPGYNPTSLPSASAVGGNVLGTTYGYQYNPSSYGITSGTGWKKVTYQLDGGKNVICICYRKDSSADSAWDRGYVAIPKQTSTPVAKKNISDAVVTGYSSSYTYDGTSKKPTLTVTYASTTLTLNTDYEVAYPSDTTNVGTKTVTITGKGSYEGTKTISYSITAANISSGTVSDVNESYEATGSEIKPNFTFTVNSRTLTSGIEYTVTWPSDCTSVGSKTVLITGMGNYTGTKSFSYTITESAPTGYSPYTIVEYSDGTTRTFTQTTIDITDILF